MALLVGIDEAGYGPILGPLVVSSSAFVLDDAIVGADMWQRLKRSTSDKKRHLAGRLLVADSKKAYTKASGVKHLRRTTVAALKCAGIECESIGQLLAALCPDTAERLKSYPWYADAGGFPLEADVADVKIAAGVFADDMAANGIELIGVKSRCLDVAYYNQMVSNVKNKANVLFSATCGLIKDAFDASDSDTLQVVVDRQGGRVRYRKPLLRMFPDFELAILKETPSNSSYELKSHNRRIRLHFAVKADDRFMPVSLASMASKYLRELLIGCLNRYFGGFYPDLKPTAGYWTDGLRFINDIKEHIPNAEYDSNQLIRCR